MASKGGSKHLKRLAAPRSWALRRKDEKFVAKPSPGPHPLGNSVTLGLMLTNLLRYCKTLKEVRLILGDGLIRVDGRIRRNSDFPIGLMDVVEFPTLGETYRLLVGHKQRLIPVKIEAGEKGFKLCRIERKDVVRGGVYAYSLHDGRTYKAPKDGENLNTGWSLKIGLPKGGLIGPLPLKEGVAAGAVAGKNCGRWGIVEEITPPTAGREGLIGIAAFDGGKYLTPSRYVFVIGDSKPWVRLPIGAVT
jgi:small subunit ribosomal protein S4e